MSGRWDPVGWVTVSIEDLKLLFVLEFDCVLQCERTILVYYNLDLMFVVLAIIRICDDKTVEQQEVKAAIVCTRTMDQMTNKSVTHSVVILVSFSTFYYFYIFGSFRSQVRYFKSLEIGFTFSRWLETDCEHPFKLTDFCLLCATLTCHIFCSCLHTQ